MRFLCCRSGGLFVALSEQQRISRYNNQNTPKVVTATPKQAQDLFVAKGASGKVNHTMIKAAMSNVASMIYGLCHFFCMKSG